MALGANPLAKVDGSIPTMLLDEAPFETGEPLSLSNFLYPVVMIGVAIYFLVLQKKRRAALIADNPDKNAGAIAQRLGLTVVEGDPNLNFLYLAQPGGEFKRRVRMTGAPYGHPTDLDFSDGYEVTTDAYVYREAKRTFRCLLSVSTKEAFPDFEITLRNPNQCLAPRCVLTGQAGVGEVRLEQPQLDALLRVVAVDPRVAPVIAPMLTLLASQPFVHVLGSRGRVMTFFPRMGLPYFASDPETYLLALESIACALEGRPAPTQRAIAPGAPAPLLAR